MLVKCLLRNQARWREGKGVARGERRGGTRACAPRGAVWGRRSDIYVERRTYVKLPSQLAVAAAFNPYPLVEAEPNEVQRLLHGSRLPERKRVRERG